MYLSRVYGVLAGLAVASALAGPLAAVTFDPDVEREARGIFLELMSPFCPGESLAACRSGQAEILRNRIRQRLAAGEDRESIIASLVEAYGEGILGAPPNRGLARAAWIGPGVVAAVGLVMIVVYLRRHALRGQAAAPEVTSDPSLRARVEEELQARRS